MECDHSSYRQQPTTREQEGQQFRFENLNEKERKQESKLVVYANSKAGKQVSDWRWRCSGFLFFVTVLAILRDFASGKS
jgi:hypothetical protein